MKRLLALLLVLVLCLSAFTACGGSDDPVTPETDGDDEIVEGSDEPEMTVGFIYVGPANDGGFSEAQDNGRQAMVDYFGGRVKTLEIESVEEEANAVRTAALNLIDQGASMIVATSFGFMDAIDELADEHKDVVFLHFSGNKMNDENFGNYFGAMEEPRFLTGMVAGLMTETNKLGYVAAFPYTEILIGVNAFTLGAQYVNPDVEVNVVYTYSWHDPAQEKAAAEALLAQGYDVLAQHVDTAGPQVAAQDVGCYAIGYNMDSHDAAPGAYLTAPIWNHGAYYIDQVEKVLNGTWSPQSYYGTMADNYVILGDLYNVSDEIIAQVKDVEAAIIAGEFDVYSAGDEPVYYNDGTVMIEAGETLSRDQLWGLNGEEAMTKLVKGATGAN